jgi:16S rRNA (cytidine1402-2'-O)-methyltransferase
LKDALDVFGDREGAICREMTKLFEEVQRGLLPQLISHFETHPPRGEVVIVIEGASSISSFGEEDLEAHLERALATYSVKEAADLVSKAFGLSKREVYQRALSFKSEKTRLS